MWRKHLKKEPLKEKSLNKLKQIEVKLLDEVADEVRRLALSAEKEKKLMPLRAEQKHIQDRLDQIRANGKKRATEEYETAGAFKKFFMNKDFPKLTEPELAELHKLEKTLQDKFPYGYDINIYTVTHSVKKKLSEVQVTIAEKEKQQAELIEKKEKKRAKINAEKEKQQAKINAGRAVIAAYQGKSRRLADQVKSKLKEQIHIDPYCPYCGGDIGDAPHCDHIYPVSKGGHSRPGNMVFICADCNSKKTDLTLAQFIKKYNFQRVEVEQKLEKLEKDY